MDPRLATAFHRLNYQNNTGVSYGRLPDGTSSRPSVGGAVLLSFVWPGLGQLYAGRRRRALLYALPALLVVGGLRRIAPINILFVGPRQRSRPDSRVDRYTDRGQLRPLGQ